MSTLIPPSVLTRHKRQRSRARLGALGALVVVLALVLAPAGLAAADTPATTGPLRVNAIDSTQPNQASVAFTYTGSADDLRKVQVRVGGKDVSASAAKPRAQSDITGAVVFVLDRSQTMGKSDQLTAIRDQVAAMISDLPSNTQVAVVDYGDQATTQVALTEDHQQAINGIRDLGTPRGDHAALWNALRLASTELLGAQQSVSSIVLVTNGLDDLSTVPQNDALTSVSQSHAAFYVVDTGGSKTLKSSGLDSVAANSGGQVTMVQGSANVPKALAAVAKTLNQQYVVTFSSANATGQTSLDLQVGSSKTSASFVNGAFATGAHAVAPASTSTPWGPSFLRSDFAKYLSLLIVAIAVGLAVYVVAHLVAGERSALQTVLQPYSDGYVSEEEEDENAGALAQTALLQRAVQMTEEFAERQGFLAQVEERLERADLPLRAAEAIFFCVVAALIVGVLGVALAGLFMGVIVLIFAALIPATVVNFIARRRQKKFNALLPDMLSLLSGSLRAGYSLMQGVEAVAQEVSEPMGKELRRVVTEARLGRDLEEALDGVAQRMDSMDFEWAIMAVRIQREVGGNLAELLMTVAETMIQRERMRREVAALTAEGKISAIMLGLLPPGVTFAMWIMNPTYIKVLFTETLGMVFLGIGIVMMLIGFAWMKKCITIDV